MLKRLTLSLVAFAVLPGTAVAHDMFLVISDHDVPANQKVAIALYNGTFDKSENTIDRERMIDVSVVDANGTVTHPGVDIWTDRETTSWLKVSTGPTGTLLVGVSTRPNMIDLAAEEFNEYLVHDGILDTLEARQETGTDDEAASERYAKHVKMLLNVGGESSDTWKQRLGYPVEFVPLSNPAELFAGDTLKALVLVDGEPLADHLVYASYAGHHGHGDDDTHREAVKTRTDADGIAHVEISQSGRWYLRLIHMVPSAEEGVDYVSNWATLTFEVR